MTEEMQTLSIQLLDKTWQVRCLENQAQDLQKCAHILNNKMREVAANGNTKGNERIAVLAAIHAIYDLYMQQSQKDLYIDSLSSRIRELQNQLAKISVKEL